MDKQNQNEWSSWFTFLLAASGSAVGLGNLWKFPYIAGANGGGAFVIVYLICIALLGIPIFIGELYIGRASKSDAISSFTKLDPKNGKLWSITGWIGVLTAFLILSFYSVVGGWVLDFFAKAATNAFSQKSSSEISGMLGALFGDYKTQILWHAVFMILTVAIVIGGVKRGIEKSTKILMPALCILLVILFISTTQMEGFSKAVHFLFAADFSKLSGEAILEALGHSFFTLSLGMGTMITYGSYLKPKENLIKIGIWVSLADTAIALIAGLVIFSIVFSFGLDASGGPGLMFSTLPTLFAQMPGGYLTGFAFFALVTFAAVSSSISMLEVVVSYFVKSMKLPRLPVTIATGFVAFLIGILSVLSFNVLKDYTVFGFGFFDLFDKLTGNILLPLGGLLIASFYGWVISERSIPETTSNKFIQNYLKITCRYLAPILIIIVLLVKMNVINLKEELKHAPTESSLENNQE